jgi:ribosomal-protein-alanine N-acetyltransferase
MPDLLVRDWTSEDEAEVAGWHYAGRWSVYDQPVALDAHTARRAVVSAVDGRLVGFYCMGDDARVPGLAADDGLTDLGLGMDPDLVGRGGGEAFARAVLDDLRRRLPHAPIRAVIQSWNTRSLRLAARMGFEVVGDHHTTRDGRTVAYTVLLMRPATDRPAN